MSESLIFTLSGESKKLENTFFPPIELSENKDYVLGLSSFLSFNSIPNVDANNNKIHIAGVGDIEIPTGSYEIEDIGRFLTDICKKYGITFTLKANNNTLKSEIYCDRIIKFVSDNSINKLLGFTAKELEPLKTHISNLPVSILKVNSLRIECNITTGAYFNGKKVHTIHSFFPAVPPGYKIIEVPSEVIYLPVTTKKIDYLKLRIVDQDGDLVNFRNEEVTISLHVKST